MKNAVSTLEIQLLDEYYRCERALSVHERALSSDRRKYISKKKIGGRTYFYLQWREDGHTRSQYIKAADLERIEAELAKQKRERESIKNLKRNLKQLEKALGKGLINEYRDRI